MSNKFSIDLENWPHLSKLKDQDPKKFKEVVGTFIRQMEQTAELNWYELPDKIHSSLSFDDLVSGVLRAVLTTREINPENFAALEYDLHPLALLSDQRKDFMSGELENYDWKGHFALETREVSQETIEKIIRKMLYLVRWFDIDTVSKALMTSQFPVIDPKDTAKLPFQPALIYQKEKLGELFTGKFRHEIGAFDLGTVKEGTLEYDELYTRKCPACHVGEVIKVKEFLVCPRCNGSFELGHIE